MRALLPFTKTSSSWSWYSPRFALVLGTLLLQQGAFLFAQQNSIPFQRDIYYDLDRNHARLVSKQHTALRPYIERNADLNNVIMHRVDSSKHYSTFSLKVFKEHLIEVRKKDVRLDIDFMFDFSFGTDILEDTEVSDERFLSNNTRGFRVAGDLGKKLSFQTSFYENQSIDPLYYNLFIKNNGVVPGQGRAKKLDVRGMDYGWSAGVLSYSPIEQLNVQFGQDKHFIGNGYRSILLSDAAFNYPFVKFTYQPLRPRWQYSTIYARLQSMDRQPIGDTPESLFYWKGATFNFLSFTVNKRLQVGLFESTIWQVFDSTGMKPFNYMRTNPIIGVNSAVYGFDDVNNVLLGLDVKLKLTDRIQLYGQFALDDPSREKYGWQAGAKFFDLFIPELYLQLEYNKVLPYTFAHAVPIQNYSHFNQGLGHPYGAYFNELFGMLQYRIKQWTFKWKVNYAQYNLDHDMQNYGGNILNPDTGEKPEGDPVTRNLYFNDVEISFLINQMSNLRMKGGMWARDLDNAPKHINTIYFYLGVSTNLFNKYHDF